MISLRYAVAIANFQQPITQALRTATSIKARGIQISLHQDFKPEDLSDSARKHFLRMLGELALSMSSVHLPTRHGLLDLEGIDKRLDDIRTAMNLAWQLKCPHLTLRIGRIPSDKDSKEYQTLREILSELARYSNHIGTFLCLIPTNDSAESLRSMIDQVTSGFLGVDFDPAGFALGGQKVTDALRMLHDRVLHFQGRDAIRDIDGTGQEAPIGQGVVPWDEVLALLLEMNYQGWVTINRTRGDHRIIDSANAIQYLTELGFR